MLVIVGWSISCEIDLRWISLDLIVFCNGCQKKNLMHCFITTLRLLLHIYVIHQASASCPRSWAQAEWIFNHIRVTFPANELQWVGMGLKQCRLLSTKTVLGTCSINHQWSPDIVSILIRCNQTFCVEINWTESIISSKDLGKWLGMFCLGCRIPNRRWFPRLHVHTY